MWNHRLFLLTGEAKYYDVLEQTLYNSLLCGVSLGGDEFFYTNPLESDGQFRFNHGSAGRQSWFDVSCCPTNLCRFFPSLPGYVHATVDTALYVNLFIAGRADIQIGGVPFHVVQETDYPWDGAVRLRIGPEQRARMELRVRIPGWAREQIMGGNLYRFERPHPEAPSLRLNGETVHVEMDKGFAVLDREWDEGDMVELSLPMPVRKVLCDDRVVDNRGKAALQRVPIVYCVEGRDAERPLDAISLGPEADYTACREPGLLGGIVALRAEGVTAIPYFAWANRGTGPMRVWLRNKDAN